MRRGFIPGKELSLKRDLSRSVAEPSFPLWPCFVGKGILEAYAEAAESYHAGASQHITAL